MLSPFLEDRITDLSTDIWDLSKEKLGFQNKSNKNKGKDSRVQWERSYLHELHGDQPEPLLLEPLDDVAAEAALHAVGLDHDEGTLVVAHLEERQENWK